MAGVDLISVAALTLAAGITAGTTDNPRFTFAQVLAQARRRQPLALVTVVAGPDRLGERAVVGAEGLRRPGAWEPDLAHRAVALGQACLERRRPLTSGGATRLYAEPYLPSLRLIICGAGHVGQALAEMAALVGFAVTVLDDRAEYARPERFPRAEQVLHAPFATGLARLQPGPADYVVVTTRGHNHDLDCLRQVLQAPVAYVGMIGSRRRVDTICDLLAAEGTDLRACTNFYAPIGLDLGANTPAEIALSITAELVRVRRGGTGEHLSRLRRNRVHGGGRSASAELAPLEALLALPPGEPAALATLIQARGHCPREAGAKMLVDAYGRTTGTVGGGCGEAAVRRAALNVLASGHPQLLVVDLLDDPAIPDGAVCGGKMELFVERV